ncbi:hypothetical protein HaLaN_05167 [Haematococcus lacustris]|uniref:Uncharacterized protein n=1 Tax=Haematococcus lacustris TaxID=44745 RepID=A0A699YSN3_HAELA|nr:hypothetical protein HaLaN_05167 [Haematococcus lacustris]
MGSQGKPGGKHGITRQALRQAWDHKASLDHKARLPSQPLALPCMQSFRPPAAAGPAEAPTPSSDACANTRPAATGAGAVPRIAPRRRKGCIVLVNHCHMLATFLPVPRSLRLVEVVERPPSPTLSSAACAFCPVHSLEVASVSQLTGAAAPVAAAVDCRKPDTTSLAACCIWLVSACTFLPVPDTAGLIVVSLVMVSRSLLAAKSTLTFQGSPLLLRLRLRPSTSLQWLLGEASAAASAQLVCGVMTMRRCSSHGPPPPTELLQQGRSWFGSSGDEVCQDTQQCSAGSSTLNNEVGQGVQRHKCHHKTSSSMV